MTKEDFILSSMVVDYSNDKEMVREIFEYLDTVRAGVNIRTKAESCHNKSCALFLKRITKSSRVCS